MTRRPTVAERDDLEERLFVLKEALRALLHLNQMENDGISLPFMSAHWSKAWDDARSVLGEDGPGR